MMSNGNNSSACDPLIDNCALVHDATRILILIGLLIGVILPFIFCCMQRQANRSMCCGLHIPVNLLTITKYRLVYTLVFGAMAHTLFYILTTQAPFVQLPGTSNLSRFETSIVQMLFKVFLLMLLPPLYYPLFACVSAPVLLLGYFVGFIQCLLFLAQSGLDIYYTYGGCGVICRSTGIFLALDMGGVTFSVVCLLLVTLWYLFSLIREVVVSCKLKKLRESPGENIGNEYHYNRVKKLLRDRFGTTTALQRISKKLYPFDRGFKYPLRFMAAVIVALYMLYKLTLIGLTVSIGIAERVIRLRNQLIRLSEEGSSLRTAVINLLDELEFYGIANTTEAIIDGAQDVIFGGLLGIAIVPVASVTMSFILCLVSLILTYRSVSEHLHRVSKSDLSFLPPELPALPTRLSSAIHFPGYQAAYMFWAWIVYTLLSAVVGMVLLVFFYVVKYATSFITDYALSLLVLLVWILAVVVFETIMCRFVFLVRRDLKRGILVINNRRLYHWFTYMMFFLDAFIGLISCFIRILLSMLFGLLFIMRMDRVVLMRGLESLDTAHKTYVGFIYMEYIQNNSIMNVFVDILCKQVSEPPRKIRGSLTEFHRSRSSFRPLPTEDLPINSSYTVKLSKPRSQRPFNRWMVAYTLLKNPQLIKMRSSHLQQRRGNYQC